MRVRANWSIVLMTAAVLGLVFAAGFNQQPLVAQSSDQKAEEAFKNIKSLKGQRADMLNPTMVFSKQRSASAARTATTRTPTSASSTQAAEGDRAADDRDGERDQQDDLPGPAEASAASRVTRGGAFQSVCPNVTNHPLPPGVWARTTSRVCRRRRPSRRRSPARRCMDKYIASLGGAKGAAGRQPRCRRHRDAAPARTRFPVAADRDFLEGARHGADW